MKRELKYYHGLIVFAIVIIASLTAFTFAQRLWGIWGLAVTELGFLAITLIAAVVFSKTHNLTLSDIFPLKLPPVKQFFAGAFIYGGTYMLIIPIALITQVIFPAISEVTDTISDVGTQASVLVTVIIMALMPAICEEMLHRGLILSSFKSIRKKDGSCNIVLIVVCIGIIFGVFHLDPYRFLPTAVLGGALAYIALKTNSMLLTMLFHFFNNLMSVIAITALDKISAVAPDAAAVPDVMLEYSVPMVAGLCMIYLGIAVILLFIGKRLFSNDRASTKKIFIAVMLSFVLFIAGSIITASDSLNQMKAQGYDPIAEYDKIINGYADDGGSGKTDIIGHNGILGSL